jgi:ABC-type branched-subunit amino acid transport system ATPase component/preprotein translocase subunit SecG
MLYQQNWMFTVLSNGQPVPRPSIGASDQRFYYVVLIIVVISALIMVLIHEGRLGRVLRGLSESPVAVTTMGLSTNMTRVIVFCISAFFAGIAGALYAASVHFAVSSDAHFDSFYSLTLLALLALSPLAEPWYAVFGLIASIIPGYLQGANVNNWLNAIFGLSAIYVALQGGHPGMPPRLREYFGRFARAKPAPSAVPAASAVAAPSAAAANGEAALGEAARGEAGSLQVEGLKVSFGGLVAVDGLSFSVPPGRITGLIGPNGAGKTTTFDAVSGLNRRAGGRVTLDGRDVTRLSASARGRAGIGRTFQRMALCDGLTVEDNVRLGRESALAGGNVVRQVVSGRSERAETRDAAISAMEICGILDIADQQAGSLSTGKRRLVELARCLAGQFDVLLLDEPSSGLDAAETEAFDAVLQRTVAERGCGVLLVEHDMSLVMNVCQYIYVLDFGRLLYEGPPASVTSNSAVQAAYLGYDSMAAAEASAKGAITSGPSHEGTGSDSRSGA